MIIAELTLKQIEKIAKSDEVTDISFYEEFVKFAQSDTITMEQVKSSTKIDLIHNIGLTGVGVNVGVIDMHNLNLSVNAEQLPANRFEIIGNGTEINSSPHVLNTLLIGFSESGVAPGVNCYIDCLHSFYDAVEALITKHVAIINVSLAYNYLLTYNEMEMWTDHVSVNHNVSIVQSAGNQRADTNPYSHIASPGLAYNIITVGAMDNCNTYSDADDSLFDSSCYVNDGCCEKPDIVAPANMLGGGTSSAAPFVSGIIALMLELRPSLAAYPQAVKAILLASCHHKASSSPTETMAQGITDKQVAGVVDAYRAISITGRGNYGIRSMTGGVVSTDVKFNVPHLYGAEGINVSIAWLKNNSISESDHNTNNFSNGNAHNLNLEVLKGSTSLGTSTKNNSSTEMVYINSPTNATYTIRINKVNSNVDTVKVGYAWSFSKEQFYFADDNEGIFFIKNKNSGKYLNYSSSAGVTQKNFMESLFQRWVVYKKANGQYTINSFVGKTGCLDVNNLVNSKYYSVALDSANVADVAMFQNSDGSVTISKTTGGYTYQLCILDNSTSDNVQAVWKRIDSASDLEFNQQWYLEPLCFQLGDVNMDGSITADDARTVLQYSSGTENIESSTSRNVLIYLADADSDGQITAADSRLILRISAGLE